MKRLFTDDEIKQHREHEKAMIQNRDYAGLQLFWEHKKRESDRRSEIFLSRWDDAC